MYPGMNATPKIQRLSSSTEGDTTYAQYAVELGGVSYTALDIANENDGCWDIERADGKGLAKDERKAVVRAVQNWRRGV